MTKTKTLITADKFNEILKPRLDKIADLLPSAQKHQANRFLAIAQLTFVTSKNAEKLAQCTQASLVQCVLEAAQVGFPLDDKNAYPIPYNNTVDGKKRLEAQCQFDYKAYIALARRQHVISDMWGRTVYQEDEFDMHEVNGVQQYHFRPDLTRDTKDDTKKKPIGAFAAARLSDQTFKIEWLPIAELERIRKISKSPESPAWKQFRDRMFIKIAIRRLVLGGGLLDDPGSETPLTKAINIDDKFYDMEKLAYQRPAPEGPRTLNALSGAVNGETEPAPEPEEPPSDTAEPENNEDDNEPKITALDEFKIEIDGLTDQEKIEDALDRFIASTDNEEWQEKAQSYAEEAVS